MPQAVPSVRAWIQQLPTNILIVIGGAALGAVILASVLGAVIGSRAPQLNATSHAATIVSNAQDESAVHYVPYAGVTTSGEAADPSAPADSIALQQLSDVLREPLDESALVYGSDGGEGAILPIDNGVLPSSGQRFATDWELILPSAGIRASVVQVGLTPHGAMGSPDNPFVVGWFNRSAAPGRPGNALLGGHRDYQDLSGNVDVGVCWELNKTQVGDQLIMFEQSSDRYLVYDIVETASIRPESLEAARFLSQTRESVVTLFTCSGEFDAETHSYSERIVVVGLLTAVAAPDAPDTPGA